MDSTSESELSASVASLASLQPITSAVASVIMSMAAAIKSAHDAAAASALNRPRPSEDVVMVSADPILIVNSIDQPAIESAEIRTEIAMSGLTISGPSAPDSLVKYAIMASLRQGAGTPMPLGAGIAQVLQATQIDGIPGQGC